MKKLWVEDQVLCMGPCTCSTRDPGLSCRSISLMSLWSFHPIPRNNDPHRLGQPNPAAAPVPSHSCPEGQEECFRGWEACVEPFIPQLLLSVQICFLICFLFVFSSGEERREGASAFSESSVYFSFCCVEILNGEALIFLPPWEACAFFKNTLALVQHCCLVLPAEEPMGLKAESVTVCVPSPTLHGAYDMYWLSVCCGRLEWEQDRERMRIEEKHQAWRGTLKCVFASLP